MQSKTIYFLILAVVAMTFGADIYLIINNQRSAPSASTIPYAASFATAAVYQSDIPEQSLPTLYNLPPEISWPQIVKLRLFLYQFGINNSSSTPADGYYRDESISESSGNTSILLDVPSVKQTLSITAVPNDTLDISCGLLIDQKDSSWKCLDNTLGESE